MSQSYFNRAVRTLAAFGGHNKAQGLLCRQIALHNKMLRFLVTGKKNSFSKQYFSDNWTVILFAHHLSSCMQK